MFLLEGETKPIRTLKLVRREPTSESAYLMLEQGNLAQVLMSFYEVPGIGLVYARYGVKDRSTLEDFGVRTTSLPHPEGDRRHYMLERLG